MQICETKIQDFKESAMFPRLQYVAWLLKSGTLTPPSHWIFFRGTGGRGGGAGD